MARLDSATRLPWPRRIMVSMTSLRNRLAAAPSPSSPVRSSYSRAIWKDSSSNWEREIVMRGKRTRTARVPCHRPCVERLRPSTATGSDRNTTSPNTCVSCFHHAGNGRIPPVAPKGIVHGHDLPLLVLRVRRDPPGYPQRASRGTIYVFRGPGPPAPASLLACLPSRACSRGRKNVSRRKPSDAFCPPGAPCGRQGRSDERTSSQTSLK